MPIKKRLSFLDDSRWHVLSSRPSQRPATARARTEHDVRALLAGLLLQVLELSPRSAPARTSGDTWSLPEEPGEVSQSRGPAHGTGQEGIPWGGEPVRGVWGESERGLCEEARHGGALCRERRGQAGAAAGSKGFCASLRGEAPGSGERGSVAPRAVFCEDNLELRVGWDVAVRIGGPV